MGASKSLACRAEKILIKACNHPRSKYEVRKIRWIRVPLAQDFVQGASEVGQWVVGAGTMGLLAWFNGGVKGLSHECIEIVYTCSLCGHCGWFVAEMLEKGRTHFFSGSYNYCYIDKCTSYQPSSMTVANAERIYDEIKRNEKGHVFENCSQWCDNYWSKL